MEKRTEDDVTLIKMSEEELKEQCPELFKWLNLDKKSSKAYN